MTSFKNMKFNEILLINNNTFTMLISWGCRRHFLYKYGKHHYFWNIRLNSVNHGGWQDLSIYSIGMPGNAEISGYVIILLCQIFQNRGNFIILWNWNKPFKLIHVVKNDLMRMITNITQLCEQKKINKSYIKTINCLLY